ncbi:amidohydrolase family protein [Arcicella rigui]|uniref:Amidohydrolase family protein n=1 Tax=Arcicella rigui TaxID=797020 RepID=A0ABU5QDM9_9BACT|nr:amidohydrolase family protein [Arcicella rigui]MEA5140956.1 amidohydrolase family protein [Arcicella rigui]
MKHNYAMRVLLGILLVAGYFPSVLAQSTKKHLPIIDVHVHASKANPNIPDLCPWFLKSMPGADPKQTTSPSIFSNECPDPLKAAKTDKEMQEALLATAERLNVTMIVSGDASIIHNWHKAAPNRIIPSLGISNSKDMTVKAFEDSLTAGFYKVMGEVAPQYQGMSPSDPSLDEYFGVAEKLGVPVGIHMGTGGNGTINITNPKYRASLGRPFLLEDMLAKHPKLKIWVMHAGYPMADEMIALMGANAYVYVDLAGFIWSYPLEEIHAYLRRLIQAGFGKRIMYGTDLMIWPKLLETSIQVIESANYLSEDQKRDIFFNNAVRFFNLDPNRFK